MKKISFIGLFIIIFVFASNAQGVYSIQSLEKDSLQTLNLHLEKAQKLKKTGLVMTILGPVGCVAGFTIAGLSYSGGTYAGFVAGTLFFVGGLISTVVGLPILITNSSRVKRVKAAINNHPFSGFNIAPSFIYLTTSQNIYPGATLRVRF